jgi:hypothetical protein
MERVLREAGGRGAPVGRRRGGSAVVERGEWGRVGEGVYGSERMRFEVPFLLSVSGICRRMRRCVSSANFASRILLAGGKESVVTA